MITPQQLSTVASAITAIENATTQIATAPVSNAQKLQAAVGFIGAVDPAIGAWIVPVETVINAMVAMYNMLGIFHHGAAQPASTA
jgi:hypothetical protein